MSTFIALLASLAAYTGTVAVANWLQSVPGSPLSYDIMRALSVLSNNYALEYGVPAPFHWAVGGLILILPALICYWLVRNIFR